jgi:transcriptional regulator with GAF, ATPase, and Fis domain
MIKSAAGDRPGALVLAVKDGVGRLRQSGQPLEQPQALRGQTMSEQMLPVPMHALAALGTVDLREHDLAAVLGRIAEVAKRTIPGTAEASVTLVQGGDATTAAYTGGLALALDERQYEEERGPCLDAAASGTVISLPEMENEDRWARFAHAATEVGVHSSLSVGMPVQDAVVGALNLYATKPHAFDADATALARTFGNYAAIALANAHLYSSSAALAAQMQQAMESRAMIDQAIGITMVKRGCTAEEAFNVLVRASQEANRKLREVAKSVVQAAPDDPRSDAD